MSGNQPKLHLPPISAAAPGALYEQIVHGVKREISDGRLKPGDPLPSFRVLAEVLRVSLITVKRAYEELERQGIIFRKQGLGTFVTDDGAVRTREAHGMQAKKWMRRAIQDAREAGMHDREIVRLIRQLLRDE